MYGDELPPLKPSLSRLFRELGDALDAQLYWMALAVALALPDICSGLGQEGPTPSKPRYIAWFDANLPDYRGELSGLMCYELRCAVLHEGRGKQEGRGRTKVVFTAPTPDRNQYHGNRTDSVLQLDVDRFCRDMLAAARNWEQQARSTAVYRENIKQGLTWYPTGTAGFVGMPVWA